MILHNIDGKNYKKILKDLDLVAYPSLPKFLVDMRAKLLRKETLSVAEEVLTKSGLIKYFTDSKKVLNAHEIDTFDWSIFDHRPPLDFQKEGIRFLALRDGALLADDQGLGKSLQAICATKVFSDHWNILIVTLGGLKYNFANEIAHYDSRISIIEDKWLPDKYTIVHYEQFKKYRKQIIDAQFDIIIIDECHRLKHSTSKRAQYFADIQQKSKKEIKKIWLLTGTPVDNSPKELYTMLKLIRHPITKNYREYSKRYCNAYEDMFGRWNDSGSSNLDELHQKTKSVILRRLKTQVGNLPNKYRHPIFYEMTDVKGYKLALKDYIENKYEWLDDINFKPRDKQINPMVKMMIWRQFCAMKRIKDGTTLELITNELDKGKKIIVGSNFTKVVEEIYKIIGPKECIILDGRVPKEERVKLIDTFNKSEKLKVISANLSVISTGYNIQSATCGIVNDMALVPSTMLQFEDRMYRLGQKSDVDMYYPIYQNTIEEALYNLISEKMRIITSIVDGKEGKYFETQEYQDLFSQVESITKDQITKELFEKIDLMKVIF